MLSAKRRQRGSRRIGSAPKAMIIVVADVVVTAEGNTAIADSHPDDGWARARKLRDYRGHKPLACVERGTPETWETHSFCRREKKRQ